MPVLKLDNIAVFVTADQRGQPLQSERYVLKQWQSFHLETSGVYTLEGPNQAGKSVLIKLLMGVLPPSIKGVADSKMIVGNEAVLISHVSEAHANGLVAIFQDDQLIPSMTIREQFTMRHATPGWKNVLHWIWGVIYKKIVGYPLPYLRSMGVNVDWVKKHLGPQESKIYPSEGVITRAEIFLASYGEEFVGILDKYPRQLSGGAVAVARLVNAQLSSGIKVLFLDEAFNSVQKDLWPRLIDALKEWRRNSGATIVAVTHNLEEIIRWQPTRRIFIEKGEITYKGLKGYESLESGLPIYVRSFPIFSPPYRESWLEEFSGPFFVIADENVKKLPATEQILEFIKRSQGETPKLCSVSVKEMNKTWDTYLEIFTEASSFFPQPAGAIVILGGGVLLNLAGFVAATLYRGKIPFVLVPTTLMAMADVAIGSKTSLNVFGSGGHAPLKNIIGIYANPSAVLMDSAFLTTLPAVEKKNGLSECLKHGLMQDSNVFTRVRDLMTQENPSDRECFEVARETMALKSVVLANDPWEEGVGKVLLYGHLHAHIMERIARFQVSHGTAVLWGLLIDLAIAGELEIYNEVLTSVKKTKLINHPSFFDSSESDLLALYKADPKFNRSGFPIIKLGRVGEYKDLVKLNYKHASWQDINLAIFKVRSDLNS